MALYQRGRVWYADYYVRGKRIQVSTKAASRREAEKFYARRITEIERGSFFLPAKVALEEFGRQYLEHAKLHKRSWLRDEQMLKKLNGFFTGAVLTDINPFAIERYQQERIKAVSPATVNRETALLKHMFTLAEQWSCFQGRNPAKAVKFLAENNLQFRALSEEEEHALLQACSPHLQDLVVFAINTGLRHGEMLNLKWEEVDLETSTLRMLARKNRRMLEVPLNEKAEAVVRAWLMTRKGPYVFYNPDTGDRFKDLWLGLKKACKKAGLEGVTWHTFRHTFASRLTRRGVDLVTVKELLGHSEVSVTMRYAHTNYDTKARAVRLLGDKVVTISEKKRESA
jgi:integrase